MQMMGRVVKKLAPVAPRPVSRMISGSTTDRLPNTGRRLKAISSRLTASSTGWVFVIGTAVAGVARDVEEGGVEGMGAGR